MFKALVSVMLLALLAAPQLAHAEVDNNTVIPESVVAPLMAWVEQQTGAKVPVLPQVIASHTQFKKIIGGMNGGFAGRPRSVYVPGTVVMDNLSWDEDDSTELSLLVHELVHHAQFFMKNANWSCPDAREAMAYNLQNKWLEQHGHNAFVNAAWIERVSDCGSSIINPALAQSPNN